MQLKIKINMDNAAFDEPVEELQRIFRGLADKLLEVHSGMENSIIDVNGNKIGRMVITD